MAIVTEFYWMIVLRALNGAALATLMPISQSIIADLTVPSERGYAFGWVQCMVNTGMIFGQKMLCYMANHGTLCCPTNLGLAAA